MSSSSSVSSGADVNGAVSHSNPSFKLKAYGFALVIIVSIGALAVAGVGASGYFQLGALSNIGQVQAIAMMAAGGGVGIVALVIGSIGLAKNFQHPHAVTSNEPFVAVIPEGRIFGPELWRWWGIEVVERVPPAPRIDWWDETDPFFKKPYRDNYVQVYIPQKVRYDGEEIEFNLNALNQLFDWKGVPFHDKVLAEFGEETHSGWIFISKRIIPSEHSNLGRDFALPFALESIVCNLFLNQFFPRQAHFPHFHFTECQEMLNNDDLVVAGDLRIAHVGLDLLSNNDSDKRGRTVVYKPSQASIEHGAFVE